MPRIVHRDKISRRKEAALLLVYKSDFFYFSTCFVLLLAEHLNPTASFRLSGRVSAMANKSGDYEADKQRLKEFLANFSSTDEEGNKTFKYAEQLTAIAHREQTSLTIDLEDVAGVDEDLANSIRENTRRYNLLVAEVVEALLPEYRTRDVPSRDALDVFIKHRQTATERAQATVAPGVQQPPAKTFPPELMRRFEVYFKTQASDKVLPIREVKAGQIGKLISIKGIVTRATEVKPMMQVATYTCDQCGAETFQPINSTSFMPQV